MVNWWNMVFSLLKRVCLGKLPVCVSKVECVCVCEHVPLWECLLLHHMHHQCSYTYSIYRLLDRWSQHRCCQQRPETSGPDCCYKPSKYLETCTVKLWSEVNTCLCWHRRTLNRCVVQIGRQIAEISFIVFWKWVRWVLWLNRLNGGRKEYDMKYKIRIFLVFA